MSNVNSALSVWQLVIMAVTTAANSRTEAAIDIR